jgi:hypothetical protein
MAGSFLEFRMTIEVHNSIHASETPIVSITAAPISIRTVTVIAMTTVSVRIPRVLHRFVPPRPWNTYRKQPRILVRTQENRGPPTGIGTTTDAPLPRGVMYAY